MAEGGHYDIVVLGGGSGGYACALRAAELGMRVALIEKDKVGGTCLHRGCIPTKALLHAAEVADSARESAKFGVKATLDGIDMAGVHVLQARRRRAGSTRACRALAEPARSTRSPARASSISPTAVQVDGDAVYTGDHIVLATGSCRKSLPGLEIDGERVITCDHALLLDRVPASAIVLGGGVIGVEFASVWKSFGADVTIVEALPHLVPLEDEASSKLLERAFRRRGIDFELGARFESRQAHRHRRRGHARGGKTLRGRAAAGRRRPRAGLGRPRLRGARRRDDPRLRRRRRACAAPRCRRLRGRRPIADPAARARRLRRGHPGRRAHRRPGASARSTTTACRASPTASPRSPRSASPRQAAERGTDVTRSTYPLGGNGKSRSSRRRARSRSSPRRRRPARSVLGIHMVGSRVGELIAEAQLIYNWEACRSTSPADPPAPDPVRGPRRGAPGARRQAAARPRLVALAARSDEHRTT